MIKCDSLNWELTLFYFKARFKSGAEIEAYGFGGRFTNVKVTVVGEDRENTVGLCGNFNGNKGDDMEGKSLYEWGFSYKYVLYIYQNITNMAWT